MKYRDDKSYPWLAVTLSDEFPRVMVGRGAKKKGTRYFGPYSHAWAIRDTVDTLLRVFPMRSCSNGVFTRSGQVGRPCLLGYIDKCAAPCVGQVSAEEHRAIVQDFCDFMGGQTAEFTKRIEKEMYAASAAMDFEKAARLRDDLGALNRALEKQAIVLGDGTDADVVAVEEDPLEVAVQVFHVRGGRVRGQRGWVAEKTEDADLGGLMERFLLQLYAAETGDGVPREILVPALPEDHAAMEEWLTGLRGSRVRVRVPQRGDKKALQETVARNAKQSMMLHKTKRASDLTSRNQALEDIQVALELPEAPLRIECFDISNLQGTEVVGSMVVFEDGLPRKSEYRRFVVRGVDGQNDVAAMHEVVTRRFRRLLDERVEHPELGRQSAAREARRPGSGRRCWSTPTPGAPSPSPTPPAWWSSTADRRRSPRPSGPSTSSASTTSRCAGWPSGSRRSGCPRRRTRSSCRAPARRCSCSSGCATRRTASPSPTTAAVGPRRWWRASSTTSRASARCAARRCCAGSARCASCGLPPWRRSARCRASDRRTAQRIADALTKDAPAPGVNTATGEIEEG